MMNSTVDDEDFPPNPFRSGTTTQPQQQQPLAAMQQPQPQQQPMMTMQQQQPPLLQQPPPLPVQQQPPPIQQQPMTTQVEEEDFFTNQTTTSSAVDPLSTTTPAPINNNMAPTQQQAPPAPRSWWQACRACCTMQTYQQYFDIDTVDISTRIKSSITTFFQPDYFRTQVVGSQRSDSLKGPDLYGPFWITMTLVFLVAVTSNLAAFIHSDDLDEFEYDISHLIRALTVLGTFSFCVPTLFWVMTQCMSMQALYLVEWVCLYGYSLVPYLPATLLCLIPSSIVVWIALGVATAISVVLILRNVAGPLLASDVSQTRSGPILLAILGTHVILLLTLKLAFYHH